MSATIECARCSASVEVAALLARIVGWYRDLDVGVARCPACGETLEFRISGSRLQLGYTYAAGSLHFEAVTEARVGSIRVAGEGDDRAVELDGVMFRRR